MSEDSNALRHVFVFAPSSSFFVEKLRSRHFANLMEETSERREWLEWLVGEDLVAPLKEGHHSKWRPERPDAVVVLPIYIPESFLAYWGTLNIPVYRYKNDALEKAHPA